MLRKINKFKVLKLFFDNPENKFHIREIGRLVKLSAPTVSKLVDELEQEQILISKKEKVVENVYADREHKKFTNLKRFYNMTQFAESGLIEFLADEYQASAIVLFGSYSRGEDTSKSDIDVAVITKRKAALSLEKFERKLKRKINIHEIQIEKCTKEFFDELMNGIVVYGYLVYPTARRKANDKRI